MHRIQWMLFGIALFVSVLDRWLKLLVLNGYEFSVGFLRIHLVENHGLVFSLYVPEALLWSGIVIASIWVVWLAVKNWSVHPKRSLAGLVILIGAISNLLDRIQYGFVIDWADLGKWLPIFNGADALILIGTVGYLWQHQLTDSRTA